MEKKEEAPENGQESSFGVADDQNDPTIAFEGRFKLVLWAVATLVVLNQLLVQPALLRMTTDAPVINIAGRQRMLSQRLAKASLAWERAHDAKEKEFRLDEIKRVLERWTQAHESLRRGNTQGFLPMVKSPEVDSGFASLEEKYVKIRDAATRLIQEPVSGQQSLETILGCESEYLDRMDGVVGLLESEAGARVAQLQRTGWAVVLMILFGLVLMVRLGLRPALRLIRRQILELNDARQELEIKVLARTQALEHESRERARAEEHQRTLVEQFSHVARTTTIGEMATGLAHELNQPLGAIANYAEGCLVVTSRAGSELEEVREALRKILNTSLRAGQIVSRIRRFVNRHDFTREPVDANRLLVEVQDFFRGDADRQGATLSLLLAPELPLVWGDPVQIQQVLVNLVRNALESLSNSQPKSPTILMKTRAVEDGGLEISVSDNGEGIPADQIAKVFDSFFSTRDEGMGMGLAISRTIAEAHQGRIYVESVPWVQTTFRLVIPPGDRDDDLGTDGLHR